MKSLCANANINELTVVAIINATIRLPLIALNNSPKITFLNTYSSNKGPIIDTKKINIGIFRAIIIIFSVLGLTCCPP